MNKELEEAIKRALITKHRGTTLISVEILEKILNYIENSIPKEEYGRRNGKTIEVAIELRNRIKQLPKGKIYGIINLGDGILLTQDEVVNKKAIKELFNYDKANYIDCIKANNKMEAIREYIEHLEKELLEGK